MNKPYLQYFVFLLLISCISIDKTEYQLLTDEDKSKIESLSHRLIKSINEFDFSIVNTHWSNDAFKERVSNLTKTQKSVLEHIFEKDLKRTIKVGNLSIIHLINSNQGKASFLKLTHFEYHSELTLLLAFNNSFNLYKYRFQIIKGQPVICDFYQFSDDFWYSQKVINSLKLNSKYKAFSNERREANIALSNSDKQLQRGDTLEALYFLYDIPESHQTGNWLTFKKLTLAQSLGDSIYTGVLVTEFDQNKSLYMKYLYHLYFSDTTELKKVYETLYSQIGKSSTLDSLIDNGSYWE